MTQSGVFMFWFTMPFCVSHSCSVPQTTLFVLPLKYTHILTTVPHLLVSFLVQSIAFSVAPSTCHRTAWVELRMRTTPCSFMRATPSTCKESGSFTPVNSTHPPSAPQRAWPDNLGMLACFLISLVLWPTLA